MREFLLIAHIMMAFGVIALILLQHGKGADTGAAFGSGASGTVFGARGSASFLSRLTAGLAILFFSNSLLLAYLAAHQQPAESLMDRVQVEQGESTGIDAPAIDAAGRGTLEDPDQLPLPGMESDPDPILEAELPALPPE
jgi:preprotein translocase subunit SecG